MPALINVPQLCPGFNVPLIPFSVRIIHRASHGLRQTTITTSHQTYRIIDSPQEVMASDYIRELEYDCPKH